MPWKVLCCGESAPCSTVMFGAAPSRGAPSTVTTSAWVPALVYVRSIVNAPAPVSTTLAVWSAALRATDTLPPAKRGITRDYTPFLLMLQGRTLQLQGIARPPF